MECSIFNFLVMQHSMKYIDYTGYYYRDVAGSATRNISKKDYFKRAVEVYNMELPKIYMKNVDKAKNK